MAGGEGVKRCSRCRQHRPRAAFPRNAACSRNKAMRDGLQAYCREHCRTCGEIKPHSERTHITEAERDEMVASRTGLRVICPKAPDGHVDHCRKTGRVRGVLCFNCNSAIGKLGGDPDAVGRAAAYLEGNSWKPILLAPGVYQLPS
ncbi:endonuclease domain-containing protein [Streptomyces sp. NPDC046197]|uniref:endonuclease domain-containing protein n=1 Tax=Streptomyces sp. NPDC046197 TaxID=3154337 RepID=UPI0033E1630A